MSLNHLLFSHQISLMRAAAASTADGRRTHEAFAANYAREVDNLTDALGGSTAPLSQGEFA